MKKKNTTIDDLTIMVKKGFDGSDKKIDNLTKEIRSNFKEVDKRFDKIENLILDDYKRRIERLEIEVKELKNLLAVK